ncbi:MAG: hypothetical protein ABJP34_01775 [Erythrobacter sp.]
MTKRLCDQRHFGTRALAAGVMLATLQGCVAAAVLPVIAGGAIATTETRNRTSDSQDTGEQSTLPEVATKAEKPDSDPATQELSMSELAAAEIASQAQDSSEVSATVPDQELGLEPAPSVFADMTAYVLKVVTDEKGPAAGQSALLSNPSRLDARRTKCSAPAYNPSAKRPPAVLIDLDDKNGIFDPTVIAPTYDGDAYGHLSRLREAGVTIGWMSALTAGDAGGIRKALQASGLDVEGKDELVLFRYPGDRKQTRRSEFGAAHCLIAIAGDDRSDFDELYQYLLQPSSAATLEPLIGNGWFLLPTGLSMRSAPKNNPAEEISETPEDAFLKADPEKLTEPDAELPPVN